LECSEATEFSTISRNEILPSNIGYVKFDGFMDASFCGPTVVAAMGFVAHTDALIIDLRQNGGGQPAMVTPMPAICSTNRRT
jgi:C-terminal processing protease CtpA/Prc